MKRELSREPSSAPSIAETIAVLADASGYRSAESSARFIAGEKQGAPDEGLFLLSTYGVIKDVAARQAILDIFAAIAFRQRGARSTVVDLFPGQSKG